MSRFARVAVAAVAALGLAFGAAGIGMYHHTVKHHAVAAGDMHVHG